MSTCCDVTEYPVQRNYGFQIHVSRVGLGGRLGVRGMDLSLPAVSWRDHTCGWLLRNRMLL